LKPHLKALVLKTSRLKETLAFFIDQLGFIIKESSLTHFVIHSKGVRIVFIESKDELEVEFYLNKTLEESLTILEDPNHIKIIIS